MKPFSSSLVLILLCLVTLSCSRVSPAEQVARQFMDAYYVTTDLKQAAGVADGLALEKVQSSLALTQGQVVDRLTHRPAIAYRLLEGHQEGSEADYLFRVKIEPPGFRPVMKKSRIKVREREGRWRVTQFADYEMEDS